MTSLGPLVGPAVYVGFSKASNLVNGGRLPLVKCSFGGNVWLAISEIGEMFGWKMTCSFGEGLC